MTANETSDKKLFKMHVRKDFHFALNTELFHVHIPKCVILKIKDLEKRVKMMNEKHQKAIGELADLDPDLYNDEDIPTEMTIQVNAGENGDVMIEFNQKINAIFLAAAEAAALGNIIISKATEAGKAVKDQEPIIILPH
jgi:hypothetical protein